MSDGVLRIAVYGPESTGKTELATRLAAHFGAPLVAEYAREHCDARGGVLGLEDMLPIALEQWRREDEAVARATAALGNLIGYQAAEASLVTQRASTEQSHLIGDKAGGARRLVVCDTEALTTMLWSDLLYGTTPDQLRRGAEKRCRNYALYLLLDTDVPFAPDPQRCFPDPEDREKCRRIWHGALERRQLPYVWIRGDWPERERAAIVAVETLLQG